MLLLLLKDVSFVVGFFEFFKITLGETISVSVILGVIIVSLSILVLAKEVGTERQQKNVVLYFWMGLMTLLLSLPITAVVLLLLLLLSGGFLLFGRPFPMDYKK